MELYCPRCETSFDEIEESTLLAGECATCHGQLTVGISHLDTSPVAGAVAMAFDTGSAVGLPLTPRFEYAGVDTAASFAETTAARTAALVGAAEEEAPSAAEDEEPEEDEEEGTATNPYAMPVDEETAATHAAPGPGPGESSVFGIDPPAAAGDGDPAAESDTRGDGGPEGGNDDGHDYRSDHGNDDHSGDTMPGADTHTSNSASLPAHLQPPSTDFSMPALPSFGGPGGDEAEPEETPEGENDPAPPAADAARPEDEQPAAGEDASAPSLPAHLQLPSFPQFDMNFDPSAATSDVTPELETSATAADSKQAGSAEDLPPAAPAPPAAAADDDAPQPPPGVPAHLMPQQLPNGLDPVAPPAAAPPAPEPAAEENLPDLPSFGLPNLRGAATKREVTLLESEAAEELATELQKKRSVLPIILGSLILIGGVAGAGYYKRAEIIELISPKTQTKHTLTKTERAEEALAKGVIAFKEATAKGAKPALARQKLATAVELYRAAIGFNPEFGDAHLRLAVAFAKQNKKADAVEQYRRYVELVPKGSTTASVKKILSDWEKAQAKKHGGTGDGKKKKRR